MVPSVISHYEILDKLGEGGMGVVYKARDTTLDRFVALKFLPPHVASSAEDKARFLQEAKAVASLTHPNICTIHSIEEGDGQSFIVMEYVEGKTLKEMPQTLPLKQAVEIGIQIADGLAAAHDKGIVHRDIKPDNIMLRKDGRVQIMDFGLAKLRGVSRLTREGSTLGTAGYMSPEQVQGHETDHRTDIFSLGVVLYELFGGESPFKGVHETALTYEIVNTDPIPLSAIRPDLDPQLDAIVLECLEKDPAERYQSVAEVGKDLRRVKRESSRSRIRGVSTVRNVSQKSALRASGPVDQKAPEKFLTPERIGWISAIGACVALSVIAVVFRPGQQSRTPSAVGTVIEASIVPPESLYIHSFGEGSGPPVLSPDGRTVAFSAVAPDGVQRIYVRPIDGTEVHSLPGTEDGAGIFWAPDGKTLGFFQGEKMKKINLLGGLPATIADCPNGRGGTWNSEGTIVFAPEFQSGLFRITADGQGIPRQVTTLDTARQEGSHRWPFFLPDGKHVLYVARASVETGEAEGDAICVASIDGSMKKILVQSSFKPVFARGYLLFAQGSVLFAQRFNSESLSLEGDPVRLREGVLTDGSNNMAAFTASDAGTLLFQTGQAVPGARPMLVNREGKVIRMLDEINEQDEPRFSPDGNQIAIYYYDTRLRRSNIWIYDLLRGGRRRLTTTSRGDFFPAWSADGGRVFFSSGGGPGSDIYVQSVTQAEGETLFLHMHAPAVVLDCSPDGNTLLVGTRTSAAGKNDLWLVPLGGGGHTPVPFHQTKFNEHSGRISPSGKWIAYVSDETGENEVYLQLLSNPGSPGWKVSSAGGHSPVWGPTANELIYVTPKGELLATTLRFTHDAAEAVSVKPLFVFPPFSLSYDISPDGKSFVITRSIEPRKFPPLSLVVNWDEALRRN